MTLLQNSLLTLSIVWLALTILYHKVNVAIYDPTHTLYKDQKPTWKSFVLPVLAVVGMVGWIVLEKI